MKALDHFGMVGTVQSQPTRAEQQLRAARHDPRLDRPRGAIAGDFTDYVEEAERVRMLHLWAVANMRGEVERVRKRLDADEHRDPAQDAAVLRAAAERAQLAEAETTNGHPYINASTLIGLHGALDALVEDLAPSFARTAPDLLSHTVIEKALRQAGAAEDLLTKDTDALRNTLRELLEPTLPRSWRPTRAGVERWEKVLRPAGLATSPQRPIPSDLDLALREITNLRDVLVHRSGRLDDKAATDCPTLVQELGFRVGHMVRLDREHYRRYSAALRAYGNDVVQRLTVPAGMDTFDDLQRWRGAHTLNA